MIPHTSDVTIGIIAALPVESAAMASLLADVELVQLEGDPNDYRLGYLDSAEPGRPHRVVLTTLPQDNTRNAAAVCTDLIRTFTRVRCVVMTGVGGGVPALNRPERHVRLGDVVVAVDGIVDYGHVRAVDGVRYLRRSVDGLSMELLRAARELEVRSYVDAAAGDRWWAPVLLRPMAVFGRPAPDTDLLYVKGYAVPHPPLAASGHIDGQPKIHHGAIGSADELVRDEDRRDQLAEQLGILAVEMEGSGIAASARLHGVSWFMVRGIADYSESTGKNDRWHAYASMTSGAYIRLLLSACRPFPVWRADPGGGARALLPDHERDRLTELLARLPTLDLRELWRASMGELTPLPAAEPSGTAALFEYLADLNAGADGLPPALALLEAVAHRAGGSLATDLRSWVDQTARRLDLIEVVRRHRAGLPLPAGAVVPVPPERMVRPSLVIQITADHIDNDRCAIRYWIQYRMGLWQPEPGEELHTTFGLAERVVADAVRRAETAWRESPDPVAVEFLLPTGLLHLNVEWWRTELASPYPPPLCVDYPVSVRSLDRMRADFQRRVWANRWNALWGDPPAHRLYWGRLADAGTDAAAWDAGLREDPALTSVVLSGSPMETPGRTELELALRAGIPVIVWDRRTRLTDETVALIGELTGGSPDALPDRVRRLRAEAAVATGSDDGGHAGRHLALLWDDPYRVIETGRPDP